ncbi:hypothetical protein LTR17_020637 [Elasticomyces elasticus]|nr:hypothetical protein LTR17_020637 [Elasticomyces elasticus]
MPQKRHANVRETMGGGDPSSMISIKVHPPPHTFKLLALLHFGPFPFERSQRNCFQVSTAMAYRILSIFGGLAFMIHGHVVYAFGNTVHETRAITQQSQVACGFKTTTRDYGKTLTTDEVTRLFAPSAVSVETVRDWLVESGVPPATIAHSNSKG